MKIRRTWPERGFLAFGALVTFAAGAVTAHYLAVGWWRQAIAPALSVITVSMMLGMFHRQTNRSPLLRGRAMWLGSIDGFVAAYADGAEPFERWGITRAHRVEVRLVFDNVETAFASYVTPTTAAAPAGLTGQPTGGVLGVDAVGGDVVPETGKPTSETGGPPAGA